MPETRPPRLLSYAITLACLCPDAVEIRLTMASDLYHDARCPSCGRVWLSTLTFTAQEGPIPTTEQAYSLRYDPETNAYDAEVYIATTGQVLWTTPETTNDLGALHAAVQARYPQAVYRA